MPQNISMWRKKTTAYPFYEVSLSGNITISRSRLYFALFLYTNLIETNFLGERGSVFFKNPFKKGRFCDKLSELPSPTQTILKLLIKLNVSLADSTNIYRREASEYRNFLFYLFINSL